MQLYANAPPTHVQPAGACIASVALTLEEAAAERAAGTNDAGVGVRCHAVPCCCACWREAGLCAGLKLAVESGLNAGSALSSTSPSCTDARRLGKAPLGAAGGCSGCAMLRPP